MPTASISCIETEKDKHPVLKRNLVDFTLDLPFSVYQNNPVKFEKDFIKEISKALNIDESRIRFIEARKG